MKKQATLDFLLTKRNSKRDDFFIVEQKNFFAYRNGKLRTINNSSDFKKNFKSWTEYKSKTTPAWRIFNQYENFKYQVKTKSVGKINDLKGAILIWSDVNEKEAEDFKSRYGFSAVIGLTRMVNELNSWNDKGWKKFIADREIWLNELFSNLNKY